MKRAIIVLLIVAAIGAGAGAYYIRRNGGDITVNTSPLTRGDIVDTVGATGTLQAVTTVQVGSHVSGNISYLGADFNSIVRKGQVIAKLDPSLFQAQVEQARANLARAQADVERNQVALTDAQQKHARATELGARGLVPQSDLDAAKIAVDSARASLQSAQAQVVQARAALNQSQVNLNHTIIQAPIDGIVTQRSVDVGQTVAASLQSPTLFVIAADLTKMQVNANIDEADVGRIRPGQHVTFRVDAYPTEEFTGTVAQVRLQPVVVQNVTTYGTIINVPNKDLKLKPGMTANLRVQIARRSDVVRVPNAALRFRPTTDIFAALDQSVLPEAQSVGARGGRGVQDGSPRGGGGPERGSDAAVPGASTPGATAASAPPTGSAGDAPGRRTRAMDRFTAMSPDERSQILARMKARGQDVSAFEQTTAPKAPRPVERPTPDAPPAAQTPAAQTIDALFAPLQPVESQGRVWLFVNRQLKPVRLCLGISDGTNTALLGGELTPGTEVVTGVILSGSSTRSTAPGGGTGNPLMPGRGGPGGLGRGR